MSSNQSTANLEKKSIIITREVREGCSYKTIEEERSIDNVVVETEVNDGINDGFESVYARVLRLLAPLNTF